jgi:inosose dehydratase
MTCACSPKFLPYNPISISDFVLPLVILTTKLLIIMENKNLRRQFFSQLGILSAATLLPSGFLSSCSSEKKQESNDNQQDSTTVKTEATPIRNAKISWGCSIITWGEETEKGIQEIAALGYKGIQLRSNLYKTYKDKPAELKAMLDKYPLAFPIFSSGNVEIDKAKEKETIEMHVNHAKFISEVGGKYLQLTNAARPKDRKPTEAELVRLATVMNEIGKRTNEIGIMPIYHNHMHQLGENPEEIDVIVENCNPQYVNFLLDIAHYFQGGGDPAKAVIYHQDKLKALHIKDVADLERDGKPSYQFVELGQGKMNLPELFNALEEVKFEGWVIDELDAVPQGVTRSPAECHQLSKKYVQEVLKYKI